MTLTYSAYEPSGTVLVWQEGEGAEFASVYADLTGSKGSFDEKVERAKEIVSAVNEARGVPRPWTNSDLPWSERGRG